jgi:hypothetical protein
MMSAAGLTAVKMTGIHLQGEWEAADRQHLVTAAFALPAPGAVSTDSRPGHCVLVQMMARVFNFASSMLVAASATAFMQATAVGNVAWMPGTTGIAGYTTHAFT